jgi:hypothetical protein
VTCLRREIEDPTIVASSRTTGLPFPFPCRFESTRTKENEIRLASEKGLSRSKVEVEGKNGENLTKTTRGKTGKASE